MTLSTFRNKLWHSQPHQSLRSLISTRQPALEAVGVLCRRVLIANRLIPWYQVDQMVSELIAIDSLSVHLSPRVCAPVSSYSHHLLSVLPAFVTCLFVEYSRQEYPHEQVGKRVWAFLWLLFLPSEFAVTVCSPKWFWMLFMVVKGRLQVRWESSLSVRLREVLWNK